MKKTLLTLLVTLCALVGSAQTTANISATVVDQQTKQPVAGAVVELIPTKNPTQKKYTSTSSKGVINAVADVGSYTMKITFLGYAPLERQITIPKTGLVLGRLEMKQQSQRIDDVVLEVQAMRTSQKGDTVMYNADAFKVAKDADAEGLLKKMPGITIIDGEVEAQGETVKKVFVDGKEFFGNDVNATIKNLPAETISKIEVFNKLSDQAELTGVDDGEGFKAINIVTKPSMRTGKFGKVYAGYGYDDKYIAGGNINIFQKNHRLSFIGLFNNLNQQNFSSDDVLGVTSSGNSSGVSSRGGGHMRMGGGGNFMVASQSGISTVSSVGVNYSGTWSPKINFQGSYFFNTTENKRITTTDRQYFTSNDTTRLYYSDQRAISRNFNHRFSGKLDYKIDANNTLSIRPNMSFQSNSSTSSSFRQNSMMFPDAQGQTIVEMINTIKQSVESDASGYNLSLAANYQHKFKKVGRTISVEANGNWTKNDGTNYNNQDIWNDDNWIDDSANVPDADELIRRKTINDTKSWRYDANVVYTEPLTDVSQLVMQYRGRINHTDAERMSFLTDEATGNVEFSPGLSNVYQSDYITHRVGPGYRLGTKKLTLVANLFYQRSELTSDRQYPTPEMSTSKSFDNVVYFGMINANFNPSNTLRVFFRSSTDTPSISQLQDVLDVSNVDYVSSGNSRLVPVYSNDIMANYSRSNISKGRTFMLMAGFNFKNNYISDSTVNVGKDPMVIYLPNGQTYTLNKFSQYTKPVNLDGYWSFRAGVSMGTPIKPIKSNLNINGMAMFSAAPTLIDGLKNTTKGQYYSAGATLGSNINENIDFTLAYNGGYNITTSSLDSRNDNTYWSQSASLRFKWSAWLGFTLSGQANYNQYTGITTDFKEEYLICNLFIGKKIFKNQRGEIQVGVNDLLNQNTSFSRNIRDQYIENVRSNVIGRYVGLTFTYNLRNFGASKPSSPSSMPENIRMMRGTGGGGHFPH